MPKKKVKLGEPKSKATPSIYRQELGLSKRKHAERVHRDRMRVQIREKKHEKPTQIVKVKKEEKQNANE